MSPQPRIVILGSRGFIGNTLFDHLRNQWGDRVLGISSADCDLAKEDSVAVLSSNLGNDAVLVIVAGIRAERDDSLFAFRDHIAMLSHIGMAIAENPPTHCIYLSTMSVYGAKSPKEIIREISPVDPDSLYAIAKYAGEKIFDRICTKRNIPLLTLRLPRVYGPNDKYAKYGPSAFVHSLKEKNEVTLYGDGQERREFLYRVDLAQLIERGIVSRSVGAVNVVSGMSHTFEEIAQMLGQIVNNSFSIYKAPRTGLPYDERYDPTQLETLFPGFVFTPLREGLRQTCQAESISIQ